MVAIGFSGGEGAGAASYIAVCFVHLQGGDPDIANAGCVEKCKGVLAGGEVESAKHVLQLCIMVSAVFVVVLADL